MYIHVRMMNIVTQYGGSPEKFMSYCSARHISVPFTPCFSPQIFANNFPEWDQISFQSGTKLK